MRDNVTAADVERTLAALATLEKLDLSRVGATLRQRLNAPAVDPSPVTQAANLRALAACGLNDVVVADLFERAGDEFEDVTGSPARTPLDRARLFRRVAAPVLGMHAVSSSSDAVSIARQLQFMTIVDEAVRVYAVEAAARALIDAWFAPAGPAATMHLAGLVAFAAIPTTTTHSAMLAAYDAFDLFEGTPGDAPDDSEDVRALTDENRDLRRRVAECEEALAKCRAELAARAPAKPPAGAATAADGEKEKQLRARSEESRKRLADSRDMEKRLAEEAAKEREAEEARKRIKMEDTSEAELAELRLKLDESAARLKALAAEKDGDETEFGRIIATLDAAADEAWKAYKVAEPGASLLGGDDDAAHVVVARILQTLAAKAAACVTERRTRADAVAVQIKLLESDMAIAETKHELALAIANKAIEERAAAGEDKDKALAACKKELDVVRARLTKILDGVSDLQRRGGAAGDATVTGIKRDASAAVGALENARHGMIRMGGDVPGASADRAAAAADTLGAVVDAMDTPGVFTASNDDGIAFGTTPSPSMAAIVPFLGASDESWGLSQRALSAEHLRAIDIVGPFPDVANPTYVSHVRPALFGTDEALFDPAVNPKVWYFRSMMIFVDPDLARRRMDHEKAWRTGLDTIKFPADAAGMAGTLQAGQFTAPRSDDTNPFYNYILKTWGTGRAEGRAEGRADGVRASSKFGRWPAHVAKRVVHRTPGQIERRPRDARLDKAVDYRLQSTNEVLRAALTLPDEDKTNPREALFNVDMYGGDIRAMAAVLFELARRMIEDLILYWNTAVGITPETPLAARRAARAFHPLMFRHYYVRRAGSDTLYPVRHRMFDHRDVFDAYFTSKLLLPDSATRTKQSTLQPLLPDGAALDLDAEGVSPWSFRNWHRLFFYQADFSESVRASGGEVLVGGVAAASGETDTREFHPLAAGGAIRKYNAFVRRMADIMFRVFRESLVFEPVVVDSANIGTLADALAEDDADDNFDALVVASETAYWAPARWERPGATAVVDDDAARLVTSRAHLERMGVVDGAYAPAAPAAPAAAGTRAWAKRVGGDVLQLDDKDVDGRMRLYARAIESAHLFTDDAKDIFRKLRNVVAKRLGPNITYEEDAALTALFA